MALSAASIRNTMQDLTQLGLLAAPHSSAGRLPTHAGLRLFVDGLLEIGDLSSEERRAVDARLIGKGRVSGFAPALPGQARLSRHDRPPRLGAPARSTSAGPARASPAVPAPD